MRFNLTNNLKSEKGNNNCNFNKSIQSRAGKREKNINENKLKNKRVIFNNFKNNLIKKNNNKEFSKARKRGKKNSIAYLRVTLICLFLILLTIPGAFSLGVAPGRTTLEYEQALDTEVKLSVFNSEYKQMNVEILAQGELADYITLSETHMNFSSLDHSKEFSYKIKLPKDLENKPGLHTAEIVVLESPEESGGGTYVGATVAVVSQVYVYVSCPGKCIEADLDLLEQKEGASITLIVPVINRGKLKIEEAKAVIEIYSREEKIETLETNVNSIEPKMRTELSAQWQNKKQGNYKAKVQVFYDGEKISFEKEFSIGEDIVGVKRVWVNDFVLGGIAKFRILVENKWNKDLTDVFANLIVYDAGHNEISNVKSASENIPALTEKELLAYWDTKNVEQGEYDGKLKIISQKNLAENNLVLRLNENSLEVLGVGQVIGGVEGEGIGITNILIGLVVILLIGNVIWFVFYRRRKKKKKIKEKKEVKEKK